MPSRAGRGRVGPRRTRCVGPWPPRQTIAPAARGPIAERQADPPVARVVASTRSCGLNHQRPIRVASAARPGKSSNIWLALNMRPRLSGRRRQGKRRDRALVLRPRPSLPPAIRAVRDASRTLVVGRVDQGTQNLLRRCGGRETRAPGADSHRGHRTVRSRRLPHPAPRALAPRGRETGKTASGPMRPRPQVLWGAAHSSARPAARAGGQRALPRCCRNTSAAHSPFGRRGLSPMKAAERLVEEVARAKRFGRPARQGAPSRLSPCIKNRAARPQPGC